MGKLMLYTVQGSPKENTADSHGLSEYLGYRPVFCTRLEKESLAESWFRIWAASVTCPKQICLFEMDEEDCIPVNRIDWANLCRKGGKPAADELQAVLNNRKPAMTDYLVKEIPDSARSVSIRALCQDPGVFTALCGFREHDRIVPMLRLQQSAIDRMFKDTLMLAGLTGRSYAAPDSSDVLYDVMRMTGLVPLLWAIGTENMLMDLMELIQPVMFTTFSFMRAQTLLSEWDRSMADPDAVFTEEQYEEMRDAFLRTLDSIANKLITEMARGQGVGSNSPCICGSGKKFRACHQKATLDDLALKRRKAGGKR